MPPNPADPHQALHAAMDTAYDRKGFRNDAERGGALREFLER